MFNLKPNNYEFNDERTMDAFSSEALLFERRLTV